MYKKNPLSTLDVVTPKGAIILASEIAPETEVFSDASPYDDQITKARGLATDGIPLVIVNGTFVE